MPPLLQDLFDWIARSPELAYVAIFVVLIASGVGVPVAEEIIVVGAGVMIQREWVNPIWAWVVCYVGIMIADSIVVYIGWHFGKAVLHRRWVRRILHPRRLLWARHQINEHGAWMIAASRFIPGSRWATLLIAGMMHIPRWKFLLADGVAAIGSVTLQLAAGYYIGKLASDEFSSAQRWLTIGSLAIAGALIAGYVYYRKRHGGPRKPIRLGRFRKTRRNADASSA